MKDLNIAINKLYHLKNKFKNKEKLSIEEIWIFKNLTSDVVKILMRLTDEKNN